MNLKHPFLTLYITGLILVFGSGAKAQIDVFEASKSDSTRYTSSNYQDSIYMIYKEGNNRSSISLYADFDGIDSLNFEWSKFDVEAMNFKFIRLKTWATSDTIVYDDPALLMDTVAGGYKVRIYNESKNIDTVFTTWVWYQDFVINSIQVVRSTCKELGIEANYVFDEEFKYYDLTTGNFEQLSISNEVEFVWTTETETDKQAVTKYGPTPNFVAPYVPTTFNLVATDRYKYIREKSLYIDETSENRNGNPFLIATKAIFSGINGIEIAGENEPLRTDSSETGVQVEAPHGIWFNNLSKNGRMYEWVFYNHIDWYRSIDDTVLEISNFFEPTDSIFYKRPRRREESPVGYDVKLTSWGPEYNEYGDRCFDSIRFENFVLVDSTEFPSRYKELPNVFTPNGTNEKYKNFYFQVKENQDDKPVKSVQYFSIKIYNRYGNKIYEYEDDDGSWHEDGKAYPGWDGITRVGTQAKPGVYYYAILAKGWDGRDFEVGGYVHIF